MSKIEEYPMYVPLENGFIIVDNKEEELKAKGEKNERTSESNSERADKKIPNANRNPRGRGKSD